MPRLFRLGDLAPSFSCLRKAIRSEMLSQRALWAWGCAGVEAGRASEAVGAGGATGLARGCTVFRGRLIFTSTSGSDTAATLTRGRWPSTGSSQASGCHCFSGSSAPSGSYVTSKRRVSALRAVTSPVYHVPERGHQQTVTESPTPSDGLLPPLDLRLMMPFIRPSDTARSGYGGRSLSFSSPAHAERERFFWLVHPYLAGVSPSLSVLSSSSPRLPTYLRLPVHGVAPRPSAPLTLTHT